MDANDWKCPVCARPLIMLEEYHRSRGAKTKRASKDKLCCTHCEKTFFPHEVNGPAGSLSCRDVRRAAAEASEVDW